MFSAKIEIRAKGYRNSPGAQKKDQLTLPGERQRINRSQHI